jgi:hypothetical protein
MQWQLTLATTVTKAPASVRGVVFGLFVAAGAEADTRNHVISSVTSTCLPGAVGRLIPGTGPGLPASCQPGQHLA